MAMETGAAVGAVAAAGSGYALFNYNRSNFQYDASFRFERFTSAREFGLAQANQYRADLRALTDLTQRKCGLYAMIAALNLALCVALYCAGRLGLHGPSPPTWIMGLWYTNNAAAFCFMILTIWLAIHASFRAQSASVHLLTRKVRLPVPTLQQLDVARRFGSEFEQQCWSDIFRVPYISNNGAPKTDEPALGHGRGRARSASPTARRSHFDRKASTWVREEFETDRAGTVSGPSGLPYEAAPEHFRLYGAAQKDWFYWDIYARIGLFYGFSCYVHSLCYYGLGHINVELRAFWVAYATEFVIAVLHALLLRFDIVPKKNRKDRLPNCEYLGPLAVLPAALGMSLDFRVQFSKFWIAVTWVMVFTAYIMELLYHLRMLEILIPDETLSEIEEEIGSSWWPKWRAPSCFQHVFYFVAPPERLQPGQHDIVRELREGTQSVEPWGGPESEGGGDVSQGAAAQLQLQYADRLFEWAFSVEVFQRISEKSRLRLRELYENYAAARDSEQLQVVQECISGVEAIAAAEGLGQEQVGYDSGHSSEGYGSGKEEDTRRWHKPLPIFSSGKGPDPPALVYSIQFVLTCTWVYLILTLVVDIFLGEQGLVTAPHWSRPPMTRLSRVPHEIGTPIGFPWYAGAKPWLPEQMAWHEEKRNAERQTLGSWDSVIGPAPARRMESHSDLRAAVSSLLGAIHAGVNTVPPAPAPVTWPRFFEPQLLACTPSGTGVAALTSRGFGAMARLAAEGQAVAAEPFKLSGLLELGPLVGASWGVSAADTSGLLLISKSGSLATCAGPQPQNGAAWSCAASSALPSRLPLAQNSRLIAAAAAWLQLGVSLEPQLHVAFQEENAPGVVAVFTLEGEDWLPAGEVRVPHAGRLGGRISLSFGKDHLFVATDAGTAVAHSLEDGQRSEMLHPWGHSGKWRAACSSPSGSIHLYLPQTGSQRWPEIATFDHGKDMVL